MAILPQTGSQTPPPAPHPAPRGTYLPVVPRQNETPHHNGASTAGTASDQSNGQDDPPRKTPATKGDHVPTAVREFKMMASLLNGGVICLGGSATEWDLCL